MHNVAVIGAGVMGSDVALHFACHGYHVLLKDRCNTALERAKARMSESFRIACMMNPAIRHLSFDDILADVDFATDYSELADCRYVIENVTETWDAKRKVYEELNTVCAENTFFFANTSCISITKIASLLKGRENVIGLHFMNPVPLKELV